MKTQAFIIHLARAQQRRPQVDRIVEGLPFQANVVDAVDGHALSHEEIGAVYRRKLHRPHYPFALRHQEVACFLSHRKAWQTILDSGLDYGLIVEDDAQIDFEAFDRIWSSARDILVPGDYLRFPRKFRPGECPRQRSRTHVFRPDLPGLGMVLQLVGRDAAAALLRSTTPFDRPVDTLIQMRWLHPIRILSSAPICVHEVATQMGGSLIQGAEKGARERLVRAVRRSRYRLLTRLRNMADRI